MITRKVALVVMSLLLLAIPAAASVVVFDNLPINGTITAWTINFEFAVSDSFTLASGASVSGVNLGVWLVSGDTMTGVDWAITSGSLGTGTSYGSGTAAVSATLAGLPAYAGTNPNIFGYQIDLASFSFPAFHLNPGTYYLTLQNAVSPGANPIFWDENDGPGVDVWHNTEGHLSNNPDACDAGGSGTCAEAFQILGDVSSVPEPATWFLLGSGILAVAGLRRKLVRR
jgi:hypothetical protein